MVSELRKPEKSNLTHFMSWEKPWYKNQIANSLEVQWLGLCVFIARGLWHGQNNKQQQQKNHKDMIRQSSLFYEQICNNQISTKF